MAALPTTKRVEKSTVIHAWFLRPVRQAHRAERHEVSYIGVGGVGKKGRGIRSRLKSHNRKKRGWTHYSFFEVHDNVTADEIR